MTFTLHTTHSEETFGDAARYTFNKAGLLVVRTGDGRQRTYSPNAWTYIEEPQVDSTMHVF